MKILSEISTYIRPIPVSIFIIVLAHRTYGDFDMLNDSPSEGNSPSDQPDNVASINISQNFSKDLQGKIY